MFSFGGARRRPKLNHEPVSEPLTAAETQYIMSRGPKTASISLHQDRMQFGESVKAGRHSLMSPRAMDDESLRSTSISINRDSQSKHLNTSRQSIEVQRPERIKKQSSFASISSYYDRKKYPLSITQQTSASSIRDLAIRKGLPPVVGSPLAVPPKNDVARKRPSRLDFSSFFSKSSPRQDQSQSTILSTEPAPTSPVLGSTRYESRSRSFLRNSYARTDSIALGSSRENFSKKPASTFSKPISERPSHAVHNWFDGLEGYISDDDNDFEPGMQPEYIDDNYGRPYSNGSAMNRSMPDLRPEDERWPSYPPEPMPSEIPPLPVTPRSRVVPGSHSASMDRLQIRQKSTTTVASASGVSSFSALSSVNLHEDSVLCLSSSDDEEQVQDKIPPRRRGSRKASIRDSVGTDFLDSDVEICTAQAVQPATLWPAKTLNHSKSLPPGKLAQHKTKAGLRDSQIPSRRSSKHSVARLENHELFSGTDAGLVKTPIVYQASSDSAAIKKWNRKSGASFLGQSPPRMMALTSQEASLLEAMRSKKAAMRRNVLNEISSSPNQPPESRVSPRRREGSDAATLSYAQSEHDASQQKRPAFGHSATNESSLASERVSLIFSEGLSSPATGRLSPTTPTLDTFQDYHGVLGPAVMGDLNPPNIDLGHSGHTRCRTSSSNIVVLDHLQPMTKAEGKQGTEEYPWGFL